MVVDLNKTWRSWSLEQWDLFREYSILDCKVSVLSEDPKKLERQLKTEMFLLAKPFCPDERLAIGIPVHVVEEHIVWVMTWETLASYEAGGECCPREWNEGYREYLDWDNGLPEYVVEKAVELIDWKEVAENCHDYFEDEQIDVSEFPEVFRTKIEQAVKNYPLEASAGKSKHTMQGLIDLHKKRSGSS